uniref:Extended synaptotagmin-1-like n=1 Tax=Seriola lalandi dorsalis TaxID=1841481 RepID=A0A3B4WM74_SERLL
QIHIDNRRTFLFYTDILSLLMDLFWSSNVPKHPKGISAVAVLWTFGKCLGALLPVYLAGYYRVSTSLLVFGMMVYTGWKHAREAKEARLKSAIQLLDNEQEYTSMKVSKIKRDLPAWVNFPDVEKVEWLNKVLQQVWPFVGQYLEKLLVETIAPSIRASSTHLQTLSFTKVDMGDKAMKVVGIKAHTENDKGQVLLDLYISYVGNVEINVEVKRYFCKAGVKGIQLHGMMRVILEPLIGDVPIVGAVTMFFIQRPVRPSAFTSICPFLKYSMIMDAIASFLVLPNRLVVPLVPGLHVAQLRSPLPRGVVRIHLLEAKNLAAKDSYVKGVMAGWSDPYAILRVGPQTFTSKHFDNTDSPRWEEMYEVIVHEVPGQELEVEVYDKDPDQDDFLGRTKLDLGIVKKSVVVDDWFTLKDTPTGRVHFRLEWLALLPSTDRLEQILKRNESVTSKNADPPSSAILVVYLDKAEALPMKKGNKEPNPMVQLSVQDVTRESKTCYTTVNPEWEEAFTFFIHDPLKQDIDIQVKDADRVQTLGSLTIPLSRLLSNSNLSLDQWFQLDNSGSASRIYINTVLRVLWLDEERISSDVSSNMGAGLSKKLAQQTSPHPSFATEGLLRIHLLAGQNLVPKDNLMGGMVKGKSDPYVKINIGGEMFTSHVIKSNLNPTWNEMYEVILTQLPGQELFVEVFDKDMDMKDDFMGRLKISLKDIIDSQYTDQWYNLSDVKSGRVHLVLEWVPTASESDRLDQVLQFYSRQSYQNKAVPSAGLLFVYIEQADGLPLKKSGKEPKVGAEITLGQTSRKTTVCDRTTSPQWNEAFCYLVRDPREDILVLKFSHSWTLPIGSLVVPIRELLSEPELVLDQWFHLDGASPESQVLLRAELKVGGLFCPYTVFSISPLSFSFPLIATFCVFRSSSVDTPPVETLVSSVTLHDDVDVKETAADVIEEKVEESPSPAIAQPPHTSPDLSFASEGLLRIILLEAESLVAKDNKMGGMVKGKSDPYAKINVGEVAFKSNVIKENLNPVWNEMYEVVLRPQSGQEMQVQLYDKDMDKDDFLGRLKISVADIIRSQYTDQWYTLNDVKSGRVRLILEWVPTMSCNDTLDQVSLQSLQSYQNKAVPTAALLFVYVDRAHSLPFKKSGKEPKAGAELVFGNTTYKTKVCDRSRSPQWNEAFYFLVRDPEQEMLIVKLSSAWDQPMGSLVVPVRELLSEPQLVLDQWKHLDGALPETDHRLPVCFKSLTMFTLQGMLRIHLLEAKNLVAKDNLMGGMVKGKSDPYVKINIGGMTFKSHVIKENLNPTWNEMYELVLSGPSVQEIKFEAFDKDIDADDFLGRCVSCILLNVDQVSQELIWYTLNDVKSGQVHLILEWVPTVSDSVRLDQVLQLQSLQSYQNKAVPSAALLFVNIERAHSLPLKKSGKEPKAGAELVLGETTYKTNLCDRSTSPQWNESFYFLVHDPKHQMLVVKLSSGWDQPMGSLVVTVKELLAEPQLVLDQWFHLDGASPETQILLRAELKILDSKMVDMISEGTLPCAASSCGSGNGQVKLSLSYILCLSVHRGLLSQSKDGVDSYVSLMLLPDKSKATKRKTAVKKRDHKPEYNERFEYDLPMEETKFKRLSVSVKNNSASFRSRDIIGQVSLRLYSNYTCLSWHRAHGRTSNFRFLKCTASHTY